MYIRYKLYRASKPDEVFNAEMIEVLIEKDDHILMIDKVIQDVLYQHMLSLDEVKRFGTGYIGKMDIVNIEMTDKDNLNMDEASFREYMSNIMPYLEIIWSVSTNDIPELEKPIESENNEN